MDTSSSVDIDGVSKVYGSGPGGFKALDNVSLSIRQNEFFTLLGPSGCGKTTLLRILAGFDYQSSGSILVGGAIVDSLPPYRRPINTVFQNYALFPHMSVAGNILFGMKMREIEEAERNHRLNQVIALVHLQGLENRQPRQLSGGQQQRVALARALVNSPKVLLLDEPLSALDLKLRKEMQVELKRLQHETGITFIFVTHDQEEALTMSDRIAVMRDGKVLQVGTPTDIYENPTTQFAAKFIGETNFIDVEATDSGDNQVLLRFPSGGTLVVPTSAPRKAARSVTVALRPERCQLTSTGEGALIEGSVQEIVYFGTDTSYFVKLNNGVTVSARVQNSDGARPKFSRCEGVGISFTADAVSILTD